jgi:threonine dehydrogenase-like Zn-dependent dehydrogenase
MPRFKGLGGPCGEGGYGAAPVHELVGDVIESASPDMETGKRVVGTLGRGAGLAETTVASASMFIPVPEDLDDVTAVVIQPLATVLRASAKFPDVKGLRAAVIGTGPCGLAFCQILKHRGATHLSAVDPVERAGTAKSFGATEFFHMSSTQWADALDDANRPQLVVEAVGHQQVTVRDAVHGVAEHGYVFGFGEPDDPDYNIPYEELYLKDVTLASGRTIGRWPEVLRAGLDYLSRHGPDFEAYVSHVVAVKDVQRAYSLYAEPQVGRLKVVIVP